MHKNLLNLQEIKKEIYLKKSESQNVNIIAVSKTFSMEHIMPLIKNGHNHFGENKVQEANIKWSNVLVDNKDIKLHMLGKLQTNKVKQAVKLFDYIHSLDSLKLANKILLEQKKINKELKLFIQLNVDNEDQKNGIAINELQDFYECLVHEMKMNIIGLMCIPSIHSDKKIIYDKMNLLKKKMGLNELSMGMSSDYVEAIKFGSTYVRIGSKIFGQRN
jgi:PLP dependent protein